MQFSDGYLDVIIMKACPKLSLLSLMTGLSSGTHVKSPYVFYFKVSKIKLLNHIAAFKSRSFTSPIPKVTKIFCLIFCLYCANIQQVKAFVLEPGARAEDPTKEGIVDSDGEVLARGKGAYKCQQKTLMSYNKLQITVDQGLATLFTPEQNIHFS